MKHLTTIALRPAALAAIALAAIAHAQAPATPTVPAAPRQGPPAAPAAPAAPGRPVVSAPPAPADPKEIPFEGAAPSAAEIFRKHLDATGGEQAWAGKTQMRSKGAIEIPSAGLKGSNETVAVAPDKVLVTIDLPGMGQTRSGSDGTVGWSIDPMRGPALMDDKQLAQLRQEANFRLDVELAKDPKDAQVTGLFDFEGAPCWRVTMKPAGGTGEMHRFYDKETGLLRGMGMKMPTPMGEIPATVVTSDYKDFGGIMLSTRSVMKVMGQQQVMTVDEVAWDGVDPKAFELPAEIKALKEAPAKPEGGAATADPGTPAPPAGK